MYQSKMGIISFRIIGEQKIPKGQTCGKNYTTFGDKIWEGQIYNDRDLANLSPSRTCIFWTMISHSFIITISVFLWGQLWVTTQQSIFTVWAYRLRCLVDLSGGVIIPLYKWETEKGNLLLSGIRFHVLYRVSLCFLLMGQIYIMIYYPTVNVQPLLSKILVYRYFSLKIF